MIVVIIKTGEFNDLSPLDINVIRGRFTILSSCSFSGSSNYRGLVPHITIANCWTVSELQEFFSA